MAQGLNREDEHHVDEDGHLITHDNKDMDHVENQNAANRRRKADRDGK